MRLLSDNKTGTRYMLTVDMEMDDVEIVEWKCPTCNHRWLEYSDEPEYPEVCPLCGCGLRDK